MIEGIGLDDDPGRVQGIDGIEVGVRLPIAISTLFGDSTSDGQSAARDLLARFGLARLSRMSEVEIATQTRLPTVAAQRLVAAFAIGRELEVGKRDEAPAMRSPGQVYAWMRPMMRGLEQEQFHTLVLDARHRLIESVRVSEGTLSSSLVHPREVFRVAIRSGAAAAVVVHNHPSGDPEPSDEDMHVTRRLVAAGKLLGIPILDHVVLGEGAWVSMRERMSFESVPEPLLS
ncbi:MAG: DNA repair protein RadC [Planctomycetota bacterium]|jgi:DNA repair protein RadC